MYFGAIEAGGTKFVCAIGNENFEIIERISIKTTTPKETLEKVFKFFDKFKLNSIGIGSFGPIDVNLNSKTYGFIKKTPKVEWINFDFLGTVKKRYNVPIAFTTDVNAAALAELEKGAAVGYDSCLYLTVGTGIGGGAVVKGKLLEGYGHPEMGHILIRPHEDDLFKGICPYHVNCLEGLASGPAIEKRFGIKADKLPEENLAWKLQSYYLAQGILNYILILSPEKIVLGGGVMKQKHLFPLIHSQLKKLMNGYIQVPQLESYIVSPKLGDDAGITGCLILAKKVLCLKD